MTMGRNPHWPHELAEALGNVAITFAHYDFVFGHLVGFAENLDKTLLYREVLTLPPSEKLKRLRRRARTRTDNVSQLYSNLCDRFEELLEDRNRYIHAYWYRVQGESDKFTFVDIHGKKGKLSKETHTCTVQDVLIVAAWCATQVHNLRILSSIEETAGFFTYYLPPDALPLSATTPRKIPFGYRKRDKDHAR